MEQKDVQVSGTPQNQAEMDARIAAIVRRQESWDEGSIMGMLGGRCLGGSFERREIELRYVTKDWMANTIGTTHGGMIAAMLDNAVGTAALIMSAYGGVVPTAELHISYLKPVPVGEAIRIRVCLDQIGRRMIRSRAELRLESDDTLLATAAGISCPKAGKSTAN